MNIKVLMTKGNEDLFPQKAHYNDAAFDLCSSEDLLVKAQCRELIPTAVKLALPDGYEAQIRSRSGLAYKSGIFVLNSPGTIDAGYRGEIKIILFNTTQQDFAIKRGDRIAQMLIQKLPDISLVQVGELSDTLRSDSGFGSSGIGKKN